MIAALGMYPFAELARHYDVLWARIRAGVAWAPERLDRTIALREAWTHPELALGQTCGLPLVETLGRSVRVVGAFHPTVPGAAGEHYRAAVLATRAGAPADFGDDIAAVNEPDSLSGCVSLLHCLHGAIDGTTAAVQRTVCTGSHVASLKLLQRGGAAVASIDAVTLAHVTRLQPELVADLHHIGWGPLVPSLALITSGSTDDARLAELRRAVADAVADPALSLTCRALQIGGFTPLEYEDYQAAIGPLLARPG